MNSDQLHLPAWACASPRRREHIARVATLLEQWADDLHVDPDERAAWVDAGRLHDALRDAPEPVLRAMVPDPGLTAPILHGPACAARLVQEGESRLPVVAAIRFHTVGNGHWDRTGRALYMADFLEPGRTFQSGERALLARRVVHDFDGVFRQVVRSRLEWALREGQTLYPETVALWNSLK